MSHPSGPGPSLPDALVPFAEQLVQGPTRYGSMTWLRHDDPVGVALSRYGQWAQSELSLLCALLRPGDTVVDVGSYVGSHALAFASAVGQSGRVVACEPQPVVVDVLRHNAATAAAPVEVRHVAVGAAPGHLSVRVPTVERHGNFGAAALSPTDPGEPAAPGSVPVVTEPVVRVPVVTVDGLSLPTLRLLKIDVEGMEEQVLAGAVRCLGELRPFVYAECNTVQDGSGVLARLLDADYDVYLHRAAAFDPLNVGGDPVNVFGPACESNLLAVPAGAAPETASLLAGRDDLVRVRDLDDLAAELLHTPRYGDATADDRDPAALRKRLVVAQAAHAEALAEAAAQARAQAERDARELRRRQQRADAALAQASAAGRERDAALAALQEVRAELTRERARRTEIEHSTAWRISAPVRAVGDLKRAALAHPVGHGLQVLALLLTGRLRDEVRARRDRERIRASGLFDDDFYVATNPDVPLDLALDHFLRHGASEGRRPNPLFDTDWYASTNPDVTSTGMNPLVHYLLAGAGEGRDPGPGFSTTYYLATNPDVRATGTNPLAHYLRDGRAEGRAPVPPGHEADPDEAPAPRPEAPSDEDWAAVEVRAAAPGAPVVVVPVYRGLAETLRCLHSVLTSPVEQVPRLIVVDDASPEPGLPQALDRLAERGLFELVRNATNQGFVRSVNRGMRLAGDADVVLLNSDAEVYGDWLDRLRATAEAAPRRGTVTPLTNSGTIASYPRFARDNGAALELAFEELDALAARELAGQVVELPTCVGFCTYVRADCLAEVGLFDEEAFGLGYGEENDFSLRAASAGWHHVLALDVFVRHHGSTSFGATATDRQRAGLAVLRTRYAGYERLIADHVAADPAAQGRAALDLARLRRTAAGRPAVLLVVHALGGGTARHVADLARRLHDQDVMPLLLRPGADGASVLLSSPVAAATPNLRFSWGDLPDPVLLQALERLDVQHLHVHHLQGYADGAVRVPRLATALGTAYDVTLHDFMTVCPRVDMVDHTRRFCGGPEPAKCRSCIARNGSPFGRPDAAAWQAAHAAFLRSARRVVAPSADTAAHVAGVVPGLEPFVRPHPEDQAPVVRPRQPASDAVVHVAVLGALSIGKGSDLLLALAQDAERRHLPLRYHLFGYTSDDAAFARLEHLSMSGRYAPADLPDLVAASGSTLALFPAVAPETFSYTLSEAVDLGLHPVSLEVGAVAERIRGAGYGTVLPWHLVDRPASVNDALLALAPQVGSEQPRRVASPYPSLLEEYYGLALAPPTA